MSESQFLATAPLPAWLSLSHQVSPSSLPASSPSISSSPSLPLTSTTILPPSLRTRATIPPSTISPDVLNALCLMSVATLHGFGAPSPDGWIAIGRVSSGTVHSAFGDLIDNPLDNTHENRGYDDGPDASTLAELISSCLWDKYPGIEVRMPLNGGALLVKVHSNYRRSIPDVIHLLNDYSWSVTLNNALATKWIPGDNRYSLEGSEAKALAAIEQIVKWGGDRVEGLLRQYSNPYLWKSHAGKLCSASLSKAYPNGNDHRVVVQIPTWGEWVSEELDYPLPEKRNERQPVSDVVGTAVPLDTIAAPAITSTTSTASLTHSVPDSVSNFFPGDANNGNWLGEKRDNITTANASDSDSNSNNNSNNNNNNNRNNDNNKNADPDVVMVDPIYIKTSAKASANVGVTVGNDLDRKTNPNDDHITFKNKANDSNTVDNNNNASNNNNNGNDNEADHGNDTFRVHIGAVDNTTLWQVGLISPPAKPLTKSSGSNATRPKRATNSSSAKSSKRVKKPLAASSDHTNAVTDNAAIAVDGVTDDIISAPMATFITVAGTAATTAANTTTTSTVNTTATTAATTTANTTATAIKVTEKEVIPTASSINSSCKIGQQPTLQYDTSLVSNEQIECVVCMDRFAETMSLPCGHVVVCIECSQKLATSSNKKKCVCCRQPIQMIVWDGGAIEL